MFMTLAHMLVAPFLMKPYIGHCLLQASISLDSRSSHLQALGYMWMLYPGEGLRWH